MVTNDSSDTRKEDEALDFLLSATLSDEDKKKLEAMIGNLEQIKVLGLGED